ncbi:MAG: Gldg family protein [Coprococcus sp.]
MIAVCKREFKACFQNVIGWLFVAAVLALYGLYFYVYNLRSGYPYVSDSLSAIAFFMMIAVPILTMRSLSEERHSKTDQLMLTAPISLGRIIIGKYLALLSVFSIAMVIISITPLILSAYGTVPLGESYVAIFGFWLYGGTCIAIGVLISSLTESQVIAAVLSFAALFLGYMMSSICGLISQSGNIFTKILGCFDLYTPLYNFMNGCLDITSTVYFISLSILCLFLTCQVIQKRRWSISAKKFGTGVFSAGMIAVALAVTVMVNLLVAELPKTLTSIDATSTKLYSITEDTKVYLKGMNEDITIYVLAAEDNADTILSETLSRYESMSEHIKVEYKNPATMPTFYQKYTDTAPSSNSLIVVSEERSRVIDYSDIYEYSVDYTTYSRSVSGYDAEGQITSAIQYVTLDSSELPVIYEITGHGETSLSGGFREAVGKANINLSELTLLKEEKIPEDASALIINGPTADFSTEDAQKVIDYLDQGGKVIISCNFEHQNLTNFESILEHYGLSRVSGIVMENDKDYYCSGVQYYLLPEIASSTYTLSAHSGYIFMPYSEGISYSESEDGITYTPLLQTSESAVSKTNLETATTTELEDGDIAGPFTLAVAAEKSIDEDSTAQIVVMGACMYFTDNADQIVAGNNVVMFKDMLAAMIGDTDISTSVIASKPYTLSNLTVSAGAGLLFGITLMVIVPLLLLISGIIIWVIRRKK